MKFHNKLNYTTSAFAIAASVALAMPASAQQTAADTGGGLETIIVTAQIRAINLQETPISITALTGAALQRDRIGTVEDLGHSVAGINFTATSPQATEINIRGVTNTRLTAPTADQSVSMFMDGVYVGRSGTMNSNFYDVNRVEVIRGPQGVLLGKNVAGGAVSIISNPATFQSSGAATFTYGNYNHKQATGFVNGGLTDSLAGRLSFQYINHDGYAKDLQHGVDLENLDNAQMRGQLHYEPADSDFRASLIIDYARSKDDGINRVAVRPPGAQAQAGGPGAWVNARTAIKNLYLPNLSIRESFPTWPKFFGDAAPTPQETYRKIWSGVLKLEKDVADDIRFTSITGYRTGKANTFYDQGGVGPDNVYGVDSLLLFAEPVYFKEKIYTFTQEARLASQYGKDSKFDWILGAYYLRSRVSQFNRYWGETRYLPTLSGQSNWLDQGTTESYAGFAQAGFRVSDQIKIEAGVRYTHDRKYGVQQGFAISRASRLDPADRAALTPLALGDPNIPLASRNPLIQYGDSFIGVYGQSWSKVTPQGTINFQVNPDVLVYATVSSGFKGGGFQNSAPNTVAATRPYDPESVTNYEAGLKTELFDKTLRWNTSVFYMKYKNLQVQQTSGTCLCNIINNASSATIKGIESELLWSPTSRVQLSLSGSHLSPKYDQFIDTNGLNNTGKILQRTPRTQIAVGGDLALDFLSYAEALHLHVSYKHQSKMFWSPDNFNWEDAYGLLDGRISFSPADKNWAVSFWAKNITAKDYRTSIIAILGAEISSYGAPRTFGADVSLKF